MNRIIATACGMIGEGSVPSLNLIDIRTDASTNHVSVNATPSEVGEWIVSNADKEGVKIEEWCFNFLPYPIYLALRAAMIKRDFKI